ncbi:hypothetical protein Pcinc_032221 [Petrolisthes cinctipes]|uniref:Uncharacterized protein n=1 Tax=Petrolisthes cinctipes TaxID=88211 RepID=A0AAE1EUU8_PETCI|nr:hypothetical protein Pcinc_032221 [Petrolisthes cinctipes]
MCALHRELPRWNYNGRGGGHPVLTRIYKGRRWSDRHQSCQRREQRNIYCTYYPCTMKILGTLVFLAVIVAAAMAIAVAVAEPGYRRRSYGYGGHHGGHHGYGGHGHGGHGSSYYRRGHGHGYGGYHHRPHYHTHSYSHYH